MGERTWGSKYRNTLICIDSYENSVPVGRIANPYLKEPRKFHGVVQFLKQMELLLDEMSLPQSFTELRSFTTSAEKPAEAARSEDVGLTGARATFSVSIIFRQNASWQGVLTWMDTKMEESFRSAMERISLLDSALST